MTLKPVTEMTRDELAQEANLRIRNGFAGVPNVGLRLANVLTEITLREAGLKLDDRVVGGTFGCLGTVIHPPRGGDSSKVWIRWDANILASSYRLDHPFLEGLIKVRPEVAPSATPMSVAQAISRLVDESQEGAESLSGGLYLNEDAPDTLRVTEVSAELVTSANGLSSHFWVETSDGKRWRVAVTPEPA